VGLRPTIESLRRRDALEITFFRPSSCRKPRAEELDYFDGRRRQLISKGKWPGLVTLTVEQHRLIITYRHGYPHRSEQVTVSWTRAGRGWRPWFVCPGCGVRRTYLINWYSCYRCRFCGCGRPVYAGDRLSYKKKWQRGLRRIYNPHSPDDALSCAVRTPIQI
jgi:hypothetical protein